MKKLLLILIISVLASCTYKPVVDTAGRSGTFSENKAHEITNDIIKRATNEVKTGSKLKLYNNIMMALELKIPVVSGTTGWLKSYDRIKKFHLRKHLQF